jgi:hypothetical protein
MGLVTLPNIKAVIHKVYTYSKKHQQLSGTDEKKCTRCDRGLFVTLDGKFMTQEQLLSLGQVSEGSGITAQPVKIIRVHRDIGFSDFVHRPDFS